MSESSGTNVWGRAMNDGSFAVVFLNNNPKDTDIVCDQTCFSGMKYPAGQKLMARDLWAHVDVGVIMADTFTAKTVPGQGGCAMFRFTPTS